jgi:hypothetical protein
MKDLIVLWMINFGDKSILTLNAPKFLTEGEYKVMRQRGLLHVENECRARLTSKALEIIKGK